MRFSAFIPTLLGMNNTYVYDEFEHLNQEPSSDVALLMIYHKATFSQCESDVTIAIIPLYSVKIA